MISVEANTSIKQDYETPPEVMKAIGILFDLDVCAYPETAKASKFFTEVDDGLLQEWKGKVWMNPPYGKAIPVWLNKAYEESLQDYNEFVYCLVPARTDTKWFHEIARKGSIYLMKGRVSFLSEGKKIGSPLFPSMLVVYNKNLSSGINTWDWRVNEK